MRVMWGWKEKWFGKHTYVYLAGRTGISDRVYFGFHLELTTTRFELFIGLVGLCIEW